MRDFAVIASLIIVSILVGTLLFYFGPTSLNADVNSALSASIESTTTVPYSVLSKGTNTIGVHSETNYRIQTPEDFISLWSLLYGRKNGTPANVDFSKNEVLAVVDGSHPTTGYDIHVDSVLESHGVRTIVIHHLAPDSSCRVSRVPTTPFVLIMVPKTTLPLKHQDIQNKTHCM